jgi:hypothetical protein
MKGCNLRGNVLLHTALVLRISENEAQIVKRIAEGLNADLTCLLCF